MENSTKTAGFPKYQAAKVTYPIVVEVGEERLLLPLLLVVLGGGVGTASPGCGRLRLHIS